MNSRFSWTSTETEANDDPVLVVDLDDTFHIRDEGSANWAVRKILECRAYRERVARWAQAETLRAEREESLLMHRLGGELEAWAREQIGKQHGRAKSVAVPAGVLGVRREPTKLLVVDERAPVGWCRTHLPAAIKVTESLLRSEIQAHIESTGECPSGAEIGGAPNGSTFGEKLSDFLEGGRDEWREDPPQTKDIAPVLLVIGLARQQA